MAGTSRATRASTSRQKPQAQKSQRIAQSPLRSQVGSTDTIFDKDIREVVDEVATGSVSPRKTENEPLPSQIELARLTPPPLRQAIQHLHSNVTVGEEAEILGVHLKEVIEVIGRLEGLGLQHHEIKFPRCVVLGEQSSGKSSVIEAISGVRTPRAGGTCTRCPLFIRLECSKAEASWSAQVTLRHEFNYELFAPASTFPGWIPNQNVQETDFAKCSSPNELEDAIHRAQLALVHPLADATVFAQGRNTALDEDEGHNVNFSPNVVCIYVSHPSLPNLSFYDLPGLISQSDNPHDVPLVKKLVQDYVKDPDALVLVACSLSADIATSMASGLARNEWGAGGRCVGVLTKPDLFPAGSSDGPLQKVLNNAELKFGHGYFVVKNPDQVMLNNRLTHQDAREHERQFFATTEPWCTSLKEHHGRFGTENLQKFLSDKLAGLMVQALPAIHDQIDQRINQVDAELATIPEPPPIHGASRIVSDLLYAFSEHVRKEMEVEYPYKDWNTSWTKIQERFLEGLLAMKPRMRTAGKLDQGLYTSPGKSSKDPVCLDDDDDDGGSYPDPYPDTPKKKRKLEHGTPSKVQPRPVPDIDHRDKGTLYQLDKVSEYLQINSRLRVHDQLQPMVLNHMIKHTLKDWHIPLKVLFDDLRAQLHGYLRLIFDQHFKARSNTKLYVDGLRIVEEILNTSMDEQQYTMAVDALHDELEGPYMYHKKTFDDAKIGLLEKYHHGRFESRLRTYMKEMGEVIGPDKVPNEERLRKDDRLRRILEEDPYEKQLDVLARITSYYEVAMRRFHDTVCMRIEGKLFKRLRTKLRDDMDETLGIHNEDGSGAHKAMALLAEPGNHFKRRKELLNMKSALLEGQRHLNDLQAKHGGEDTSAPQMSNGHPVFNARTLFGPRSAHLANEMEGVTHSYHGL